MGFIMLAYLKRASRPPLFFVLLLCWSAPILADFTVDHAYTQLKKNVYLLNANLNYALSDEASRALHNGVTLTLVLHIEINRKRKWVFIDESVAELKQHYQLKYYELSNQYIIVNINTGLRESYTSLYHALKELGHLKNFPLIDKNIVDQHSDYSVHLRIALDIEALPAPLRTVAYFSKQWRLTSETYVCPLQPHK